MSASTDLDNGVLVVGGGPVGLVSAVELARRGVPVRVIDRLPGPTDEPRAALLAARTLRLLDSLGALEEFFAVGRKLVGMENRIDDHVLSRLDFSLVDSPYPYSMALPQTETERILATRLHDLGVHVEYATTLTSLTQDGEDAENLGTTVTATVVGPEGGIETIRAAWLIGADGAHSSVRALTGRRLVGGFVGEHYLMGDTEAEYDLDHNLYYIYLPNDQGSFVVVPMADNRIRMIGQITKAENVNRGPTLEWLQEMCLQRGFRARLSSPHWLTRYEVHHGQVARYRMGRVFLAGDAAHVHSPAGGHGMNTGMQDAFNLGWKLGTACTEGASIALLDSYHDERHPIAANIITYTNSLQAAMALRSPEARSKRNAALKAAAATPESQRPLVDAIEEVVVNYRTSPIVGTAEAVPVLPGDAVPPVPGTVFWDVLGSAARTFTGHIAVVIAGGDGRHATENLPDGLRVLTVGGDPVAGGDHVPDPTGSVAARFGAAAAGRIVLIRPDGYIAETVEPGQVERLAAYARTLCAPDLIATQE